MTAVVLLHFIAARAIVTLETREPNAPDQRPAFLGHRNIQAAAFDPEGRLWEIEHGTTGGDELNLVEQGKNYGWPLQAYGEEYSGEPIPNAVTARSGLEQPVYYWDPVIAPSGAQFYTGDASPPREETS